MLDGSVAARWIGGSGNWSEPANWDIGAVPNNGGGTTYSVVIDLPASDPIIRIDQGITIDSLTNFETIQIASGTTSVTTECVNAGTITVAESSARLTLSGIVTNNGNLTAGLGVLKFSAATVANTGQTITADGGVVDCQQHDERWRVTGDRQGQQHRAVHG